MSYLNGRLSNSEQTSSVSVKRGLPGVGFKLNDDGDYHLENKKLTNLKSGTDNDHALRKDQIDNLLVNFVRNPATVNLDMANRKIINLKDITNNTSIQSAVNLKYVNQKLDLKLDKSTFSVANSLPGVPVLDKISIALIPSLSVITADTNDRVSSWFDPINNINFTQNDNDKKPLIKRNSVKKRFFLRFDGTDDLLRKDSFNVRDIAGNNGDTCTVIIICNTKQTKSQSQFQYGRDNNNRFGVHLPWSDSNIYVDFGNVDNGRLLTSSLTNLIGNIEVWTIRVTESLMELFRGVSSINPVQTANITANLSSVQIGGNVSSNQELFIGCQVHTNGSATNFCEMDLYGLAMWSKSLNNDELRNMHRFLEDYFDL